eukprot:TRINITY_DN7027_c0_g1_i1.p1 TRINITY_DN7027_c0_g1~~TRINITY_DN7027_c0_g1_i1.p1  ORF type:complete len:327 (+),score=47.25 TRINITY_DN7027_c0_g1_i1:293-1273(+)
MLKSIKKQFERKNRCESSTKIKLEMANIKIKVCGTKLPGVNQVRLVFSKGDKVKSTEFQPLEQGETQFTDSLQLFLSLYRDQKGILQPKNCIIKIQYPLKGDERNAKTYAKKEINIVDYIQIGGDKQVMEVALKPKQGEGVVLLQADIFSSDNLEMDAERDQMESTTCNNCSSTELVSKSEMEEEMFETQGQQNDDGYSSQNDGGPSSCEADYVRQLEAKVEDLKKQLKSGQNELAYMENLQQKATNLEKLNGQLQQKIDDLETALRQVMLSHKSYLGLIKVLFEKLRFDMDDQFAFSLQDKQNLTQRFEESFAAINYMTSLQQTR